MIKLADQFSQIIDKARRGFGLSNERLADLAVISDVEYSLLMNGEFIEPCVRNLAAILQLNADALVAIGSGAWLPPKHPKPAGLAVFTSVHEDQIVNSYSVWDPEKRSGAFFDTGADSTEMLNDAAQRRSSVSAIFLTHTHQEQMADLARTIVSCGARSWVCNLERTAAASSFVPGRAFNIGSLRVDTRLTSGHSPGGITYVVTGLQRPVAIVGDAMLAGSIGEADVHYQEALRNCREQILSLPDNTLLCPAHGPMTTVADEKAHNPFFAGN